MTDQGSGQTPEERLAAARSWAEQLEPAEQSQYRDLPSYSQHLSPPTSGSSSTQMSERLQTVIEAAERAAEAIRADAEEQARRHLVEAQEKADRLTAERVRMISDLTDDLIEHASVVRDHSEQMVIALERAISGVSGKLQTMGAPDAGQLELDREPSPAPQPPIERGEPAADPGSAPPPSWPGEPADSRTGPEPQPDRDLASADQPDAAGESADEPSADVLLRATQLAIAGESRETIATRIREDFGLDPEPVLRQVLG